MNGSMPLSSSQVRHVRARCVLAFALVGLTSAYPCRADVTILGPTPYLSVADSPFPVDGSNSRFFLEDFEDGELNTPGIFQQSSTSIINLYLGEVAGPGSTTDSVDSDDGLIDGLGIDGHSWRSTVGVAIDTFPGILQMGVGFEFATAQGPSAPQAFGFVWTDGVPGAALRMTVVDTGGHSVSHDLAVSLGDDSRNGATAEDRFFGVRSNIGIARVTIISSIESPLGGVQSPNRFEIDHVQYGVFEPAVGIEGDFNGNGLVEQQDLDLVLANWGKPSSEAPTTWSNDPPEGNIDQTELDKVLARWGSVAPALGNASALPEPGTYWLVVAVFAATAIWKLPGVWRRSKRLSIA